MSYSKPLQKYAHIDRCILCKFETCGYRSSLILINVFFVNVIDDIYVAAELFSVQVWCEVTGKRTAQNMNGMCNQGYYKTVGNFYSSTKIDAVQQLQETLQIGIACEQNPIESDAGMNTEQDQTRTYKISTQKKKAHNS